MSLEHPNKDQSQIRNEVWNTKDDWVYEEGKEDAELPPYFKEFYSKYRDDLIGKDVLDVGCGTGRYLIRMKKDGLNVIGLEPSDGMRSRAESNLKKAGLEARLVKGESTKLDFAKGSFDFVFAKGSIHHNPWEKIRESFREIARVLRPRKFFLFQARSTDDSALDSAERVSDTGITAKDREGWKKGVIQHYFTREELLQLAVENGLEIVLGPQEIVQNDGRARWWVVYRKI